MRLVRLLVIQALVVLVCFIVIEFSLRLLKSYLRDGGAITLLRASINSQPDKKYGWFSPRSEKVDYARPCFGAIEATYNAQGMRRATVPTRKKQPQVQRVCVVGDSSSQAYQISDGDVYYHRLEKLLSTAQQPVEILPMAVGGFGTFQQAMLLKEFCLPYKPDLIIWQTDSNDPVNNSFALERYAGRDNNFRRRPYWQNGRTVYRRPMILPDWVDSVALRLVNAALISYFLDPAKTERATALVYEETTTILRDFLGPVPVPVFYFSAVEMDATLSRAFSDRGYRLVGIDPVEANMHCTHVGDSHRNAAGHEAIAQQLLAPVKQALEALR